MNKGREAEKHKIKAELCVILIKNVWLKTQSYVLKGVVPLLEKLEDEWQSSWKVWLFKKRKSYKNNHLPKQDILGIKYSQFFAPKLSIDKSGFA